MRQQQRVAAYGVCRTDRDGGGVVLVRLSDRSDLAGLWLLPGGGLEHGEAPETAVVREFAEETGLAVEVTGLREVVDDVLELPHRGTSVHTVRLVYDVREVSGELRPEADGSSDQVAVVRLDDADDLALTGFTARVLGLTRPAAAVSRAPRRPMPDSGRPGPVSPERVRRQRVAVYGVVADGGHVLLTRLSPATPDPGRWALPGGGIDFGEAARVALAREIYEEAGLRLRGSQLLTALSDRFFGTGPAGVEEDFHGIPVLYRADVEPGPHGGRAAPRVTEVAGTTDAAAWVTIESAADLPLTRMASHALRLLSGVGGAGSGAP